MLFYSYNNSNSEDDKNIDVNSNINIPYDSLMLNASISILGLFLTIIYYNNFNYSSNFNFSTLFIAAIIIILTATDIVRASIRYPKNGWKVLTIFTAVYAGIIAVLLLAIIGGLETEILQVGSKLDILFTQNKQLSSLNSIFKKIGFLNINDYVKLYPIAYAVQSLANIFKISLTKHKTHNLKK